MRSIAVVLSLLLSMVVSARESVDIFTPASGVAAQSPSVDRAATSDGKNFIFRGWLSSTSLSLPQTVFILDFGGASRLVNVGERIHGTNYKVVEREGKFFLFDFADTPRSEQLVLGGVYAIR